jgi:chemotaxis protein methyltransferase CheR
MTTAAPSPAFAGPPDPDLVRIRDLVYRVAGIFHPDNKLRLLHERCTRRMKELNNKTLGEYLNRLTTNTTQPPELVALLNEITIGETCFFRNPPQIDALRQIVIPKILEAKAGLAPRYLRLWSAGCSTGEEPYTLNMVLQEEQEMEGHLKGWSTEILATDLNDQSLAHAIEATYDSYSTRNLAEHYRKKFFEPKDNHLRVQLGARSGVSFKRLNLFDDTLASAMKGMDIIFCCNVLIYFDLASKRRVLQHFYDSLLPHGYLFLGHSESLFGVNDDFRLVHFPGSTAYVKDNRAEAEK